MKKLQVLPIIIIISSIGLLPISLKMMSNYASFFIINKDSQQLIHTSTESATLIDWCPNGTVICNARNLQETPQLVSDGAGGAIITWTDCRNVVYRGHGGSIRIGGCDIYAQRINSTGDVQWTVNGTIVCNANGDQFRTQLVSDGAEGSIIIWKDYRDEYSTKWDIYAQRVNSTGDIQWTANGTVICNARNHQEYFQLVSDGAGGAIIAWQDNRDMGTTGTNIYTQKVSSTGDVQWTVNGTAICVANGDQFYPQLVSDGAGGAIIVWQDNRDMETTETNIYTQRVNPNGDIQWTANGVPICTANYNQFYPQLVSDGIGGAIITWQDNRDVETTGTDIYTQRVNPNGDIQWIANGVPICTANYNQGKPQLVSDGVGGAIVVWQDEGTLIKIYTQRISSTGNVRWTANGVLIRKSSRGLGFSKFEGQIQLVSDGVGGAIIIWEDSRDVGNNGIDIYTQRVNPNGDIQWTANGIIICNASDHQQYPQLVSDGAGGAIIAWQDSRGDYYTREDIYAQRIFESLPKISFGYFYLLFTLFSIIVLTLILKKKILKENNFISKY